MFNVFSLSHCKNFHLAVFNAVSQKHKYDFQRLYLNPQDVNSTIMLLNSS